MKPEIKVDEKPVAIAPVILENSPEKISHVGTLVSANSIVIRKNRQTSLTKGSRLFIIFSITAMTILMTWIGIKFMARPRVMRQKVGNLVLKGQSCGWFEYNEQSHDVLFTVKTRKFRGFIVDCYSKNVEVIIPTRNNNSNNNNNNNNSSSNNKKVCYVLTATYLRFNDKALVPYLQERGFHKFMVLGEMMNDLELCEVSKDLCRGSKLMKILPILWSVKKSLFGSEEKNDDDVVEIFLL